MKNVYDIIDDANDAMRKLLNDMDYVQADDVGLDRRAAYRLWVNTDCIIVNKNDDRTLQYYGGFEYVDKEYRHEMGDYVIYMRDDERIDEHITTFYEKEQEPQEE